MEPITGIFIFVLGLCVGSFLNVCIQRLPREQSIVKPRSQCPQCGMPIAWYDNIPLISYLVLRGRCRGCRKEIPIRYFLVELASGISWVVLWGFYGSSAFFAAGVILFSILLAVSVTDLETGYIPDRLTLPGMVAGLVLCAWMPHLQGEAVWYRGLFQSFLGLLVGGGILLVTGYLGTLIFKKEAMGGGDVKLLAMMGSFLGMKEIVFVFFLAPVLAIPFGLYAKFVHRSDTMVYGPFLALTGAVFFVFGDHILSYFVF